MSVYKWKENWNFDPGEGIFERVSAEREENRAARAGESTTHTAVHDKTPWAKSWGLTKSPGQFKVKVERTILNWQGVYSHMREDIGTHEWYLRQLYLWESFS